MAVRVMRQRREDARRKLKKSLNLLLYQLSYPSHVKKGLGVGLEPTTLRWCRPLLRSGNPE